VVLAVAGRVVVLAAAAPLPGLPLLVGGCCAALKMPTWEAFAVPVWAAC
jgi:hypothetical protein